MAERGSVNPAQKRAVLIPFTARGKKQDVPGSKIRANEFRHYTVKLQHFRQSHGNSFSVQSGRGVVGGQSGLSWAWVCLVLTLLPACFCPVSSSSPLRRSLARSQPRVVTAGRAGSR